MSEGAARPAQSRAAESDAVEQFKQGVAKDALLAAYLDKQVADRWNAHLHGLFKGAWPGLLLVSAVLGIFGWREYATWAGLRKRIEDSATAATSKADQAGTLVKSTQEQADKTQKQFQDQLREMAAAQAKSAETILMTQETLRLSLQQMTSQLEASQRHSEQMQQNEQQAHRMLMDLQRQVKQAQESLDTAKQANERVLTATRQAENNLDHSAKTLTEVRDSLSQSQADIQRTLNAAFCRQFEYVTLRSRSSRLIELIGPPSDLSNPGKYVDPKKFEIMFTTDGIKDDFQLKVSVKERGAVKPLPPYERMKASEHQFPITGTPFGYRVEFVYHAKLAFDFVILKVSPDETQYAGLCGFAGVATAPEAR